MNQKIKPCSECGGEAKLHDCGYSTFNPHWVQCSECGLKSAGDIKDWNDMITALKSKRVPSKEKRRLSDALARILTADELWNLLKGRSADGRTETRSSY